jgi:hypothetical protein
MSDDVNDGDEQYSVASARDAAARDDLGTWVAEFLASPGSDNAELAEILSQTPRQWIGPVELPLNRLHRLAGPPGAPVLCPVDDDFWRDDVEEMAELVEETPWEPPPVVVTYQDGQLVVEDGNHRIEALRRARRRGAWAVVGFEDREDLDRFVAAAVS